MTGASGRPARAPRRLAVDLPAHLRGERLDAALATIVAGQSRTSLQRLLRAGRIRLRGTAARASYRVRGGERVTIELPPPLPAGLVPEALPLHILHEDAELIVLNKAPGMTVHPGAGARQGTLVHALLHHCRDLSGVGGVERPGIVHRLDRDTSGALVVAKTDAAHRALAAQFKARAVTKVYEALVWGRPARRQGIIDAPIGRHPTARVKMAITPRGRPARSDYRVARDLGEVSLLEVRPATGRTHQLRVHLAALGHPILGDRVYGRSRGGPPSDPRLARALARYAGLALHARRIGFTHPGTGARVEFEAPRPAALERLLSDLSASRAESPGGEGEAP